MNTSNVDVTTPVSLPATPRVRPRKWGAFWQSDFFKLSLWLGLHAVLGLACANFAPISKAHSVLVLVAGLWFALDGIRLERAVYAGAYLIGAEVIWRMTSGTFFYEYGKYALALICVAAILRHGLFRGTPWAIGYFILLLPSVVLPSAYLGDTDLRKMVSFNLSGPLALMLSVWLLSQVTLKKDHIARLLLCLLTPTVSVATIAAYRLLTSENVFFGRSSSKVGSGGFGPNQVAATLGLGILAGLLFVIIEKRERLLKFFLFAVLVGLGAQAALTFSRTGLYLSVLSSVTALLCLFQDRKMRLRLVAVVAALLLVGNFFLLPRLDRFTQGALSERFQNTNSSNRDTLFMADLHLWMEHPVFGTGPGFAAAERSTDLSDNVASHTEYSRMLAEHGVFGLLSLFALAAICFINLRRTHTPQQRAVVFGFMCWALLFMMVSAMRLAAPAFLIGLTSVTWAFAPRSHSEST